MIKVYSLALFSLLSGAALALETPKNDFKVTVSTSHDRLLEDVVVYLEPNNPNQFLPKTKKTLEISQLNKSFIPYISVMQTGNNVQFINQDDITHHIYSPIGKNKFSFKIKAEQQKLLQNVSHSGEVAMGCNIHDWMSGYLLVVDTPYFAKTDKVGESNFMDIPLGDYTVNIWHPQLQAQDNKETQQVSIKSSNTPQHLTVKLKSIMSAIPKQKNEDDFDFLSDY